MSAHWSSRLFIGGATGYLLFANLDLFDIFSVAIKDRHLLWITMAPKHMKREAWVYYYNHNTGHHELGFVSGAEKDWMRNTKTRLMFQVPSGHVCVEPAPGGDEDSLFQTKQQDFDNYKWNVISESAIKGSCKFVGVFPPRRLPMIPATKRKFTLLS